MNATFGDKEVTSHIQYNNCNQKEVTL